MFPSMFHKIPPLIFLRSLFHSPGSTTFVYRTTTDLDFCLILPTKPYFRAVLFRHCQPFPQQLQSYVPVYLLLSRFLPSLCCSQQSLPSSCHNTIPKPFCLLVQTLSPFQVTNVHFPFSRFLRSSTITAAFRAVLRTTSTATNQQPLFPFFFPQCHAPMFKARQAAHDHSQIFSLSVSSYVRYHPCRVAGNFASFLQSCRKFTPSCSSTFNARNSPLVLYT
jgi:hypothetical protein